MKILLAPGVEIGSQVYLRGPLTIETDVRIAARSCIDAGGGGAIVLGENASIGANSTLWPGIKVGRKLAWGILCCRSEPLMEGQV